MQARTVLLCATLMLVAPYTFAQVDRERLVNADSESGNWLSYGRNYAEDRYSTLPEITPGNVSNLKLEWYFDINTQGKLEASPLVIDGVMFSTATWSKVFAHDAASGELLWSFDPEVDRAMGRYACCGKVNRGVAAWGDSIFVGALDGRLIALDRTSGKVLWSVQTTNTDKPYSITGAPRVVNGKVIIGNGGAEFGVRGYVSAYDANDGRMLWRFYTVPGDPAKPYESPIMEQAAKTWTGDLYWKVGGGGTVWDSMAYDPELNLLYIGVGNGSPWNRWIRSPDGGDNLFLSSIVALNPDTGAYVWHYQTTPADTWDYTATQQIVLAELTIDGKEREVLMQAPKNGFFYVIDRRNGQLISAQKYVPVTWASHVNLKTGRPVETESADHSKTPQLTSPSNIGGHNWQPMAYNKDTGLVYIPVDELSRIYSTAENYQHHSEGTWNIGQLDVRSEAASQDSSGTLGAAVGSLVAWDPVAQEARWKVVLLDWGNGGVLTTQTGLVFQGTYDGRLVAYSADNGDELWHHYVGAEILAPPITFLAGGRQYIAVMAGRYPGPGPFTSDIMEKAPNRLLVYSLKGTGELPPLVERAIPPLLPVRKSDAETLALGELLYAEYCARCHGAKVKTSGAHADLRYLTAERHTQFEAIVFDGLLQPLGMGSFKHVLSREETGAIQSYVIDVSRAERARRLSR